MNHGNLKKKQTSFLIKITQSFVITYELCTDLQQDEKLQLAMNLHVHVHLLGLKKRRDVVLPFRCQNMGRSVRNLFGLKTFFTPSLV